MYFFAGKLPNTPLSCRTIQFIFKIAKQRFTLPHELNTLMMSNMELLYNLLFQTSWQTIKSLCEDKNHLGANPAMIAMLHTYMPSRQWLACAK
jgi:hypothetical protein